MSKKPVVVSPDADCDEMNKLHGEGYGYDWIYPTPDSFLVTGNFTKQPFADRSSAEAYYSGLIKTDPDGGYKISPLFLSSSLTAQRSDD